MPSEAPPNRLERGVPVIELRSAGRSFDRVAAVRDVSLTFAQGEATALIGPSGCGKSTLIKLILGLLVPTAGEVRFEGKPVGDDLLAVRRKIGYVIQEGGLFPHLTARENVSVMAAHLKWPSERIQARLTVLTELAKLESALLDRYPAELSGGQRQRVGLMRALMLDPDVLLLDEPLGALDPMVRHALQQDLKALFAELKKTVILVTHDMAEAAYLASRIVLLRAGKVVQDGPLADFQTRPAEPFVTEFLNAQRTLVTV